MDSEDSLVNALLSLPPHCFPSFSPQGMGTLLQALKEAKSFVFYMPSLEFRSLVSYWLELETSLEPSLAKALQEWKRFSE